MNTNETCDRFEREGILRIERGLSLDAHFDTCPACEDARQKYETLLARLPSAQPEVSPPLGWQSRVLQAATERDATRPMLSLTGFGAGFGRPQIFKLRWTAMAAAGAFAAFAFVTAPHSPQFEVQAETHASASLPELAVEESNGPITGEDEENTTAWPLPPPTPVAPKATPKQPAPTATTTAPKPQEDLAPPSPAPAKPAPIMSNATSHSETVANSSAQTNAPHSRHLQVTRPDKLYGFAIKYPPSAMKAKIQGETSVQCTIRADGRNTNCRILKSLPYLDDAVIRAVESARSEPIRVNGKAVDHSDHIWHITITLREIKDERTSARGLPTLNWNP